MGTTLKHKFLHHFFLLKSNIKQPLRTLPLTVAEMLYTLITDAQKQRLHKRQICKWHFSPICNKRIALIYNKIFLPNITSLHDFFFFFNGAANGRLEGFWKPNLDKFYSWAAQNIWLCFQKLSDIWDLLVDVPAGYITLFIFTKFHSAFEETFTIMALFSCLKEQLRQAFWSQFLHYSQNSNSAAAPGVLRGCWPLDTAHLKSRLALHCSPPLLQGTQASWYWRAGREERQEKIARIKLDLIKPLSPCLQGSVPHLVSRGWGELALQLPGEQRVQWKWGQPKPCM